MDLMEAQSEDAEVVLLTPGSISFSKKKRSKISIQLTKSFGEIPHYQIRNPLPIPMANGIQDVAWYTMKCDLLIYRDFLEGVKPDVIHVHSLMGIHKEFFEAAHMLHIPVLFTTHDYFGLCPKIDMMCGDTECEKTGERCSECCRYSFNEKRLLLEQTKLYELYRRNDFLIQLLRTKAMKGMLKEIRSRNPAQAAEMEQQTGNGQIVGQHTPHPLEYRTLFEYYKSIFCLITFYHFNSTVAKSIFERELGPLAGSVLGVSNHNICDRRRKRLYGEKLRIGFLGGDTPYKGMRRLLKVLDELYREENLRNLELHVYGSLDEKKYSFCHYHDAYKPKQIADVFDTMDILAVPSSWPETFGMVALEALSFGVPVIMTEKVGAKDLIINHSEKLGIVIEDSEEALKDAIRNLYFDRAQISMINQNIVEADLDLDYEKHIEKVFCLYEVAMSTCQV